MTEYWALPAVFAAGFLTEVGYVGYVRATTAGRALPAALWCSLLVALSLGAMAMFVTVTWALLMPAIAGHSIGTYVAVRYCNVHD